MDAKLVPDAALAGDIAEQVFGAVPSRIARFTTGSRHYVYDLGFANGQQAVIRIGDRNAHREMAAAVSLSRQLRPLGVKLPDLIAENVTALLPWMVLERLAGTDLGDVFDVLTVSQRAGIANAVAAAQQIVSNTPTAGRYGYGATPAAAPHASWRDVVLAHYERSKRRIGQAKLFDPAVASDITRLIDALQPQLADIAATPFLHDTTTKNVVIAPSGALSGIVDVDDLCYGDIRYPIALTYAALLGAGRDLDYAMVWLRAVGAEDDSLFRLYVALFLLDFMSEHGQVFNGNQAASDPLARHNLLTALQRQAALVL